MKKIVVIPKREEKSKFNPNITSVLGCEFWIDLKKQRVGMRWYGSDEPREWYSVNEKWLQKFRTCRFCGKRVTYARFAYAYHHIQQGYCSVKCTKAEQLKRYACCDKAKQTFCVCVYSTKCPVHGQRCHGSHD